MSFSGFRLIYSLDTILCFRIEEARAWIIQNLLKKDGLFTLSDDDMNIICNLTEGKFIIGTSETQ